jgi:predicted permease
MGSLLQDARFGTRILLRTPVVTGSILLVLALGIGANSAMFGIVDRLLLHPVPYPNPETLVFVWNYDPQGALNNSSVANFLDWRAQAKSLSDFAAWISNSFVVTGRDRPRQLEGASVTANFFRALGVKPLLGRTFLPDEDGLEGAAAAAHSAVISYRLWQKDLGADPNVLGQTIRVDSNPYTIVGVMPADFQFRWRPYDIWVPVTLNVHDRDDHILGVVARLKAPRARAAAEMAVLARSLAEAYPDSNRGWTIEVDDFQEWLLHRTLRARLLLSSAAVGLVLLIACANVASLLLARSAARNREIGVRISLGATGTRLARQLLTEGAILSLLCGGLGLALAWALIRVAPKIVPSNAIPSGPIELSIPVIWFTLVISLLTCVLFGLAPALAAARTDVQEALSDSSRGSTSGRGRQRFRQTMVAAEVAVALMLLVSAGLMVESLRQLARVDPGFDPRNVLTLRVFLPTAKYDAAQALRFHRLALQRMAALPGVKSATLGSSLPLLNTMEVAFDLEGLPPRGTGERWSVPYATVGAEYFRTLGIPLKGGRSFTEADNEKAPLVAIVNEALVARYFPNDDPIGKRILVNRPLRGQNSFEETRRLEVVGVVGNVKLTDFSPQPKPVIYVPHPQNPWSPAIWFAARTEVNPVSLGSAVRSELMAIDPDQPIEQVGSLEQMLTAQFAEPRFQTQLMGAFALMALILAALGIYGVNAYAVAQRRHEIGLRMALGAGPGDVLREIVGLGMQSTAIGIGVGLAGAVGLASLLKSALVGTSGTDPITFVSVALLLGIVAAVACYVPARKATRIDPAIALRAE